MPSSEHLRKRLAHEDLTGGRSVSDFVVKTERAGSRTVVRCFGELDVANSVRAGEVLEMVLEQPGRQPKTIVFDGTGISLLTKPGVRLLLDLARTCKERAIVLDLSLSGRARWVLDFVRLGWLGVLDDDPPHGADDAIPIDARFEMHGSENDTSWLSLVSSAKGAGPGARGVDV